MKYLYSLLILCVSSITVYSQEDCDNGYDIYLLIGQSNMAGRGTMLPSDTTDIITGVWLLNGKGIPEPAKAPLNRYSTIRKGMKMQQIGPGTSFGKAMHERSGRKILLVVNARGGSSIMSWIPENHTDAYLVKAETRVKEAMKYGRICGILWHQGETDIENSTPEYAEKFASIINHLRRALNAPDVPAAVGETGQWGWESPEKINAFNDSTLNKARSITPRCVKVSSDGLGRLYPDNEKDPHFCRNAQIELGRRYAAAILKLQQP